MTPQDLITLCKGHKVWIQTHNYPDPDAISTAFGLQQLLRHYEIKSHILYYGKIDKLSSQKLLKLCGISMHSYDDIRDTMHEEDMIILVDCQKGTSNTLNLIGDERAVIDHHPVVDGSYEYADLRITGACASIISSYYQELGIRPSKKVATALLYGLKMDTFQFSRGVTPFDIHMFSYLFNFIDPALLKGLETNNMEFSDLKAYGAAIENIQVFGNMAFSHVDFICPDALVAILSDFLLSLEEIDVVCVYARRRDGMKVSVRSERPDVHAGSLAREALDGWCKAGGHAVMAGGSIPGDIVKEFGDGFDEAIVGRFLKVLNM